jgi:hypothetical protein
MPVPSIHPDQRDPSDVVPTENYRPADPVWFYRDGVWRSALIEAVSVFAATVIYRSDSRRGTALDIRTARYVAARKEIDPLLDLDADLLGGATA